MKKCPFFPDSDQNQENLVPLETYFGVVLELIPLKMGLLRFFRVPKTVVGVLNRWGAQKGPILPPVVARKGKISFASPIAPIVPKFCLWGFFRVP